MIPTMTLVGARGCISGWWVGGGSVPAGVLRASAVQIGQHLQPSRAHCVLAVPCRSSFSWPCICCLCGLCSAGVVPARRCCWARKHPLVAYFCAAAAGDDSSRAVSFHEERTTQIAMFKTAVRWVVGGHGCVGSCLGRNNRTGGHVQAAIQVSTCVHGVNPVATVALLLSCIASVAPGSAGSSKCSGNSCQACSRPVCAPGASALPCHARLVG